ncbi:lipopolysaccharide biosynthesis protein [Flavivirga spongiicola]|uniref:Oligosaccharide flippase family protein n=1 Tax=Flavivirga spongiicola TaxID=421621 RepID=A0ABU7XSU0_9FLAO|nr:oligosaccharide flippase family protein [Flavivirga sp. MEBiC05379]MDO5978808.1 oligosaccharide flippase family protein [Flavivirga sp. MEBiC05379]
MGILKTFFKDTIIYGLAIVLPRLINFLLVRLHTDVLPNEAYSENTEFYIVAAFFNVILTYGMETSFFRFFSKNKEKERVLSTAIISIVCSTIILGVALFIFREPISQALHINTNFYNLLVSITLIDTLIVIPFAYLRVTGRPIRFASIKLINVFIIVVLNILFLSATYGSESLQNLFKVDDKVAYIFIANLIASIAVLLFVLPYFFKSKLQFDLKVLKQLLNYGWPIMIAGLAFVINENLDKWLLPRYEGEYVNGAYSACYKLAVFMTLFIQAFRMGAEPFFFNHSKEENAKETYATILKYFTIVGALGLLIVTAFIDWLQPIFIKKESYLIALDIVPIVLLANLCLGIYHNLSVWYKLTDKTRYGMYISIIGAIMTIVFNVVCIPILGFMACAYATLLAYGMMMLLSYLIGKKHYKVPYAIGRIGFYLGFSSLLSFLSFYLFERNILIGTVFLCLFLATIVLLERSQIKQLLKR